MDTTDQSEALTQLQPAETQATDESQPDQIKSLDLTLLPEACLQQITQTAGPATRRVNKHLLRAYGPLQNGIRPRGLPTTLSLCSTFARTALFSRVQTLDLSSTYARVRDSTLPVLAKACTTLQTLNLTGCFRVTDLGLVTLHPLAPTLHTLTLRGLSHNGSVTLTSLTTLTSLQTLTIPEYSNLCTHAHISSLSHLSHLTCFEVTPASHDADTIQNSTILLLHLPSLGSLRSLSLPKVNAITEDAILQLSTLTLLTHLQIGLLPRNPLLTSMLASIGALTNLSTLILDGVMLEAGDLTQMSDLIHLNHLTMTSDTQAASEITNLASLPSLTSLKLKVYGSSSQLLPLAALAGQLKELTVDSPVESVEHISSLSNLESLHIDRLQRDYNADEGNARHVQRIASAFPFLRSFSTRWLAYEFGYMSSITSLTQLTQLSLGMHELPWYQSPLISDVDRESQIPTDRDLHSLARLTLLRELSWLGVLQFYDDEAISVLSSLQHLERLDVQNCVKLTGSCLQHIPTTLRDLSLSGCTSIQKLHLEHLSRLTNLDRLDLSHCSEVVDETLMWMSNLRQLRVLDLTGCGLTGWGIRSLAQLSELSELSIGNSRELSDEGLEAMGSLPCGVQRCRLGFSGGRVSGEALAALRERCPDVFM